MDVMAEIAKVSSWPRLRNVTNCGAGSKGRVGRANRVASASGCMVQAPEGPIEKKRDQHRFSRELAPEMTSAVYRQHNTGDVTGFNEKQNRMCHIGGRAGAR